MEKARRWWKGKNEEKGKDAEEKERSGGGKMKRKKENVGDDVSVGLCPGHANCRKAKKK